MCRVLSIILFVVSITATADADTGSTDLATDRILRASCRIFAGNARGSGVIFDSDEDNYHVLTNAHVVGRVGNRVRLEFEHSGYRSGPIPGRVVRSHIARNTSIDLAIVELPRSRFPGPMPVVPLAGVGFKDESSTVLTCGAQGGAAVSLQRGHIVRRTTGLIYYKPEALPGRSGSPLFNEDGTFKENGGATKPTKQDADLTNYQVVSDLTNLELWVKLPALKTEWRHLDLKQLFA